MSDSIFYWSEALGTYITIYLIHYNKKIEAVIVITLLFFSFILGFINHNFNLLNNEIKFILPAIQIAISVISLSVFDKVSKQTN